MKKLLADILSRISAKIETCEKAMEELAQSEYLDNEEQLQLRMIAIDLHLSRNGTDRMVERLNS